MVILSREQVNRVTENVIARLMNEGFIGKDGLSGVERYENGYDEFDPNSISVDDLIKYCQGNEFLYIYKGMNGLRISAANTNDIKRFIIKALYNCSHVKPTHDVDYLITDRVDEFEDCYVGVYEVVGGIDEPLYIVYQDWDVQE